MSDLPGEMLRITVTSDEFRYYSLGVETVNAVNNRIAKGRYIEIGKK